MSSTTLIEEKPELKFRKIVTVKIDLDEANSCSTIEEQQQLIKILRETAVILENRGLRYVWLSNLADILEGK